MKQTVISSKKDKTAIKLEDNKWYYLKGDALMKSINDEDGLYQYEIEYALESGSEDRIIYYQKHGKKQVPKQNKQFYRGKTEEESRRITRQNSLTQANKLLETLIKDKEIQNLTTDKIQAMLFELAEKCDEWIWKKQNQGESSNKNDSVINSYQDVEEAQGGLTPLPPNSSLITEEMKGFHSVFLLTKPIGQDYSKQDYVNYMGKVHLVSFEEAIEMYDTLPR